jgi:hypothetical protein
MTFETWKKRAQEHADEVVPGLEPLWTEDDPYELFEVATVAYSMGQDPKAFIEEMFGEDLARMAGEAEERREAAEYEDEEDPC